MPSETDPILSRSDVEPPRKLNFIWLVPVVTVASICRGISMFARYEYYQKAFCPKNTYPCGWFNTWLQLPGITVRMQMWAMFASFVVAFISVGWWSELGDRKGRKIVLFCSIAGTMFIDLIYLIVATQEDPQDSLSLGLIIEGLLGGFVAYTGVVHAYTFDVAPTPLSRLLLFAALDALSMAGFMAGAAIGNSTRNTVAYILSVVLALFNLAYIYNALPESLKPQESAQALPQRSLLKSIFSPVSVFFRGAASRKYLPLFALAFYAYSLTSAMETTLLVYTEWSPFLPWLPRWLLLSAPRVLNIATLLCILPAIAWIFRASYGDTERGSLRVATFVAQNSILLGALSCIGVLVFCNPTPPSRVLYPLFTVLYPFTIGAGPALYALGAGYFVALGRAGEVGSLFGALALWGALGQYESFVMYSSGGTQFWESAFFLVVALMLLVPDAPPVEEDVPPNSNPEGAEV
ncbi:hypothetical protein FB451DRAFT_788756 [Mycena latifolia]|nr:hypothetical protein FB451DRAFT_788756 [Mycena latifolia]